MDRILEVLKLILAEAKKAKDFAILFLIISTCGFSYAYFHSYSVIDLKDAEINKCHQDRHISDSINYSELSKNNDVFVKLITGFYDTNKKTKNDTIK